VSVPDREGAQRLDALVRAHQSALYAFALNLCGQPSDAHDLVQDTFERALRAESAGAAAPQNDRAWLLTVLHHLFIDLCRRHTRGPQLASLDGVDVAAVEPPAPPPAWRRTRRRSERSNHEREHPR